MTTLENGYLTLETVQTCAYAMRFTELSKFLFENSYLSLIYKSEAWENVPEELKHTFSTLYGKELMVSAKFSNYKDKFMEVFPKEVDAFRVAIDAPIINLLRLVNFKSNEDYLAAYTTIETLVIKCAKDSDERDLTIIDCNRIIAAIFEHAQKLSSPIEKKSILYVKKGLI